MRRIVCLALLSLASCQSREAEVPVFPVTGELFVDGKPATNATVIFYPTNPQAPRPRGKVDAQGRFKITTRTADDGAPQGDYRVTVEWWLSNGTDAAPTNRLAAKYSLPESSGLTATVVAGPNELPAFKIPK